MKKTFPTLKIQGQSFPVMYKPNARSRSLKLRYSTCGQQILISGPRFIPSSQIQAFIQRSMAWLHKHFPQPKTYKRFVSGVSFSFLGHDLTIHHHAARASSLLKNDSILHVMCPLQKIEPLILQWIKAQAKLYFLKICEAYAPKLGVSFKNIRISDPKTRWGSCNSNGSLSFSWRLALAPRKTSFYVAIHELCHLREMNHRPAFWKLVSSLCPDYEYHRKWLKCEGASLHLWQLCP